MSNIILPAINCHAGDFECVAERVRAVESFGDAEWIQIDVADGAFTFNKTWNNPREWMSLGTALKPEIHLMVENPAAYIDEWIDAGAKRFAIHVEDAAPEDLILIEKKASERGVEFMLAMNPETDIHETKRYWSLTQKFQVLAVHPGLAGQKFLPLVLEKIKELRAALPDATIEVDGGVDDETGAAALKAGADILVAASFIFGSANPKEAYAQLREL